MKRLFLALLIVFAFANALAQQDYVDSLHREIDHAKEDTIKVLALSELALYYGFNQFDSSILYAQQAIDLSKKLNYLYGSYLGFQSLFIAFNCQGNYPKALAASLQNLEIADKIKRTKPYAFTWVNYSLGVLNREMGNFSIAILQLHEAIRFNKGAKEPDADLYFGYSHLAVAFRNLKQEDSALWYAQKGYELSLQSKRYIRYIALSAAVLGEIHNELGNSDLARRYFFIGVQQSRKYNNAFFLARNYNNLAVLFNKTGYPDSSIYYAGVSLQICRKQKFSEYALDASTLLTNIYESQHKSDSTIKYMKIMLASKDSVLGQSKVKEFQKVVFDDEQRKQEMQQEQEQRKNRTRTIVLLSALAVFLVIAFILYRNNQQKQKSNIVLQKTLSDLRTTQAQLIQSEKMASLGELTAGIAHEIQNPLNFVNNFSEVNKELIGELKSETSKEASERDDELANQLLGDIEQNLEKINHHGKRADAIVKGMLQHSRTGSGQKEPTDINSLVSEYLRLALHACLAGRQGLKAKDKASDVKLATHFDNSLSADEAGIGKINVIPQDIGRVLVNLINNAFHTVSAKAADLSKPLPDELATADSRYEPTITISTKKSGDKVEIRIQDNGNGIPQKILDKIFQPFFTTKPTGQGTGLGLSLAYDIVKAHGGEIKVETMEGEGAEFIVHLPIIHL